MDAFQHRHTGGHGVYGAPPPGQPQSYGTQPQQYQPQQPQQQPQQQLEQQLEQ